MGVGQETAHNRVEVGVGQETAHNRVGWRWGRARDSTQQGGVEVG